MRHNLYVNNRKDSRRSTSAYYNHNQRCTVSSNPGNTTLKKDKTDMILDAKINAALEKHRNNPEVRAEIQGRVYMYCVNVTIARECKDKFAVCGLQKELTAYLNTKL